MGVAMIITQAVIAPKTRWRATKLLRTGFVVTLAAAITVFVFVHPVLRR
ncbi:hypothetical protein [Schaalia hyovaginalis]|nr:hypothetical protein [Schaalia hyovaginalis]MCF2711226.1 hypothetical protein [Schaalia hyovaginalis]MDY4492149.1 hypothetical protein [Schaalia hyovaginalis]